MKNAILPLLLFFCSISFGQKKDTEWDDYFMPGVGYKLYVPKNTTNLGNYHGLMTEFVFYARAKGLESRRSGPTRVKTYGNLSIMTSSNTEAKDIFSANVGLNLSFEGQTNRNFLIPYFGLEMGGLFQRDFSTFQFSPVGGIQIITSKKVIWNVQGGYQYTTKKFDEYSGYTFSSTLNLLLWNK